MKQTSIDARTKIEPKVGTIRRKVYEAILLKGMNGMTDQEIEQQLQIDGDTIRPVRGFLVNAGLVIDSGTTRTSTKGNNCIVWRFAEEGMML